MKDALDDKTSARKLKDCVDKLSVASSSTANITNDLKNMVAAAKKAAY